MSSSDSDDKVLSNYLLSRFELVDVQLERTPLANVELQAVVSKYIDAVEDLDVIRELENVKTDLCSHRTIDKEAARVAISAAIDRIILLRSLLKERH
jgi:hypothetical protein